jgi:hypothetical protein
MQKKLLVVEVSQKGLKAVSTALILVIALTTRLIVIVHKTKKTIMKKVKFAVAAILLAANLFFLSSTSYAKEAVGDSAGITKGYKSSWNGTWICHCPTYQQFDCYCAN